MLVAVLGASLVAVGAAAQTPAGAPAARLENAAPSPSPSASPSPSPSATIASMSNLPINVDAASSDVDYRSNTVVFRDVVITQGMARVSADLARATGLDFKSSTWVFTGNVRIDREGGTLESDAARVEFRDNLLHLATVSGQPARFEQQLVRSPDKAHGRATTITYDLATDRVTFSGDAWLSDGRNEISGAQLVYNVREQRVLAEQQPGSDGRVRITIRPQDAPGKGREPPP
ncbi:MAG: Lipopolysaccharide export system protein LptA [Steroidobacteraceae bacterium]|nr:Lipopolysaccharide export system protein LptA [Steroidobacteraceae bacterium]